MGGSAIANIIKIVLVKLPGHRLSVGVGENFGVKDFHWIADVPKSNTSATNVSIAYKLNMGAPQSVSMQTNRFRQHNQDRVASYLVFIQNITK